MSDSQRIDGDRVYCHQCNHEWDRAHGGLQCPACEGEFVEIIESNPTSRPRADSPLPPSLDYQPPRSPRSPSLSDSLRNHNPWGPPDPEEDDITTFEFNTGGGGRGTFQFSTRTYTIGGTGGFRTSRDIAADEIRGNFETMLGNIMGFNQYRQPAMTTRILDFGTDRNDRGTGTPQTAQPPDLFSMLFQTAGQQQGNHPPGPFGFLGAMLNQANARRGDTVSSQEAFDRVMTQLMEQNTSSAPAPAAEEAISRLKKKPVDESMMGSDGKAECSICMDSVELGDQVTFLPCNHWFHGDCVISWLREHDTCPHCRQPISTPENRNNNSTSPSSSRRRTSRRSSTVASPTHPAGESYHREPVVSDSPSGLREARQRYYGRPRQSDHDSERPQRERRTSDRSQRSGDGGSGSGSGSGNGGGAAGGVAGWIRNRLPFSGQQ